MLWQSHHFHAYLIKTKMFCFASPFVFLCRIFMQSSHKFISDFTFSISNKSICTFFCAVELNWVEICRKFHSTFLRYAMDIYERHQTERLLRLKVNLLFWMWWCVQIHSSINAFGCFRIGNWFHCRFAALLVPKLSFSIGITTCGYLLFNARQSKIDTQYIWAVLPC